MARSIFVSLLCVLLAIFPYLLHATKGTNWYYEKWCGHGLQYLDDSKCVKHFPSVYDRDYVCNVPIYDTVPEGFQPEGPLSSIKVDTNTLLKYVTDPDVNVCTVITKRVADKSSPLGYSLYNKYFCAGDYSANTPYETWSSSKIFAMANAAGHLRTNETQCGSGNTHNQEFGLDGTVKGKHGTTPLGDLATVVCSYDTTAGYSSNSLSSYFHDIGWRDRIANLVSGQWLGMPGQTLGGNYGEATPSDLGYTVNTTSLAGAYETCAADKDPWPKTYSNSISALSEVEMTRRIALHREIPENLRWPGATWKDIQNILYGSDSSVLFSGLQWGGMSTDTAVFLQSTSQVSSLVLNTPSPLFQQDKFRIFSKLGCGYSSSRSRGEIVSNAYTCLPLYESNTDTIAKGGYEFTVTVRGSVIQDYDVSKVEKKVMTAFQDVTNFIFSHF